MTRFSIFQLLRADGRTSPRPSTPTLPQQSPTRSERWLHPPNAGRLQASELVTVVQLGAETFGAASAGFISTQASALGDNLTAVAATNRNVEDVFSFDTDFRDLGLTLVPADTGEP